jgi:hypothetical protein
MEGITEWCNKFWFKVLHNLDSSPNIIRAVVKNEIEVHVGCMGEVLVARPVVLRQFGRPGCRWDDSIKFD